MDVCSHMRDNLVSVRLYFPSAFKEFAFTDKVGVALFLQHKSLLDLSYLKNDAFIKHIISFAANSNFHSLFS